MSQQTAMKCSFIAISVPDIDISLSLSYAKKRFSLRIWEYNSALVICVRVAYFINSLEEGIKRLKYTVLCWHLDTLCWQLGTLCWKLYTLCWQLDTLCWQLYTLCWQLYTLCWQFDTLCWQLDTLCWQLDTLFWQFYTYANVSTCQM